MPLEWRKSANASEHAWQPMMFEDEDENVPSSSMVRPQPVPLSPSGDSNVAEECESSRTSEDTGIEVDHTSGSSNDNVSIATKRASEESSPSVHKVVERASDRSNKSGNMATQRASGHSSQGLNIATQRTSGQSSQRVNRAVERKEESDENGKSPRSSGTSAHRVADLGSPTKERHSRKEEPAVLSTTKKRSVISFEEKYSIASSNRNAGTTNHDSPKSKKSSRPTYHDQSIAEEASVMLRGTASDSDASMERTFALVPQGREGLQEGLWTGGSTPESSARVVPPHGWPTRPEQEAPVTPGTQRSQQDTIRSTDSHSYIGVVRNEAFWKPFLNKDHPRTSAGDEFELSADEMKHSDATEEFNVSHPVASSMLQRMQSTGFDSSGFDERCEGLTLAYDGRPGIFAPPTGKKYVVRLRVPSLRDFVHEASSISGMHGVPKQGLTRIFRTIQKHHDDPRLSRKEKYEILTEIIESRHGVPLRTASELYKAYEMLSGEYHAAFDHPIDFRLKNVDNLLLVQHAGGQAARHGLQKGDVLVSINSHIVGNMEAHQALDLLHSLATRSHTPLVLHWIRAYFSPNPAYVPPTKMATSDSMMSLESPRCKFIVPDPVSSSTLREQDDRNKKDPARRLYRYNLQHRTTEHEAAMTGNAHKTDAAGLGCTNSDTGDTSNGPVRDRELRWSRRSHEQSVAELKERPFSPAQRTSMPKMGHDLSSTHFVESTTSHAPHKRSPHAQGLLANKTGREKDQSMAASMASWSPAQRKRRSPVCSTSGSAVRLPYKGGDHAAPSAPTTSSQVRETYEHQRGVRKNDCAPPSPNHSSTRKRTPVSHAGKVQPRVSLSEIQSNSMKSVKESSRPSHHRGSAKSSRMEPSLQGDAVSAQQNPSRARSGSPTSSVQRSGDNEKQGEERFEDATINSYVQSALASPTQFASSSSTKYARSYVGRVADNSAKSQESYCRTCDRTSVRIERKLPRMLPTMPASGEAEASPAYSKSGLNLPGKGETPLSLHSLPFSATRSSPKKSHFTAITPLFKPGAKSPSFFDSEAESPAVVHSEAHSSCGGFAAAPSINSFRTAEPDSISRIADYSRAKGGNTPPSSTALSLAGLREDGLASLRGSADKSVLCASCQSPLEKETEAQLRSGSISPSSIVTHHERPRMSTDARDAATSPRAPAPSREQHAPEFQPSALTHDAATSPRTPASSRKQNESHLRRSASAHDATTSPRTSVPLQKQDAAHLHRFVDTHDAATSARTLESSQKQDATHSLANTYDAATSPRGLASPRSEQVAHLRKIAGSRNITTTTSTSASSRNLHAAELLSHCRMVDATTSPRAQQAIEPSRFAFTQEASAPSRTQQSTESCRFAYTHETSTCLNAHQATLPPMRERAPEETASTFEQPLRDTSVCDAATFSRAQDNVNLRMITRASSEAALQLAQQREEPHECWNANDVTTLLSEEKTCSSKHVENTQPPMLRRSIGNPHENMITQHAVTSSQRVTDAASWQESERNELPHANSSNEASMFQVYPTPFLYNGLPSPHQAPQADQAYSIMWCPWRKVAVPSGVPRSPNTRFDEHLDAQSASKPTGTSGERKSSPRAASLRNQVASYRAETSPLMRPTAQQCHNSVFVNDTSIASKGLDGSAPRYLQARSIDVASGCHKPRLPGPVHSGTDAVSSSRLGEKLPVHGGSRNSGLVGFVRKRTSPTSGENIPSTQAGSCRLSVPARGGSTAAEMVASDLVSGVAPSTSNSLIAHGASDFETSGATSNHRERNAPEFSRTVFSHSGGTTHEQRTPVNEECKPSSAPSWNPDTSAPVLVTTTPSNAVRSKYQKGAPVLTGVLNGMRDDTCARKSAVNVVGNDRNWNLVGAKTLLSMPARAHARSAGDGYSINSAPCPVRGFSAPMVSGYGGPLADQALREDQLLGPPDLRRSKHLVSTTRH